MNRTIRHAMLRPSRALAVAIAALGAAAAAPAQTVIGGKSAVTFPVVINQPGSYQLGANLTVPANAAMNAAIVVAADDVTLDLNGYTLAGAGTCSGEGATLNCGGGQVPTGIHSDRLNTVVRNGTVKGFSWGVRLGMSGGAPLGSHRVEDLHAYHNGNSGVMINGGTVQRVTASRNGYAGIVSRDALVLEVYAYGNRTMGFEMAGGLLRSSTARGTTQAMTTWYGNSGAKVVLRGNVFEGWYTGGYSQTDMSNTCMGAPC
jgi:hypothetical protein